MKIMFKWAVLALMIPVWAISCMSPLENENAQIVERENERLKEYLDANNITAERTEAGYYYTKDVSIPDGTPIINNSLLGIYYEIKSLDGKTIASHMNEEMEPVLFLHGEPGIVPRVINFAAGMAKEGETLTVYSPSHLAYFDYGYQQLILPYSNLIIKLKVATIYSEADRKLREEALIEAFIQENGLEGFEKNEEGIFIKLVEEGNSETEAAKNGSLVDFTFSLYHLDEEKPFAELKEGSSPARMNLGAQNNIQFMNKGFVGLHKGAKVELISPSHFGFGNSPQVIPFSIREDLYDKGYIASIARPWEPLLLKAKISEVK